MNETEISRCSGLLLISNPTYLVVRPGNLVFGPCIESIPVSPMATIEPKGIGLGSLRACTYVRAEERLRSWTRPLLRDILSAFAV